jgi:mannose-6-phosphate isomerase-like protein (cupin superfamily)
MYDDPNTFSDPYANVYKPNYYPDYSVRNLQEDGNQGLGAILSGIKREASAIDLYSRLANVAPNQKHQDDLLQAMEYKRFYLNQFTSLYMTLTGRQPMYQISNVPIPSYREGLQMALEAGIEGSEEYQRHGSLTPYPLVQQVFLRASTVERENVKRLALLNKKAIKDYGKKPYVVNIDKATKQNNTYRTALWTGEHLQVTLMSINVGDDIGLEVHPTTDQFIRIEEGQGLVQMGDSKDQVDFEKKVYDDYAIMIPAGKWHNLINTGKKPLKVYAIYAPPEHPFGTVHKTKADAMASEGNEYN